MKRLTFDGKNDLYLTPYGARTLEDYEEMKRIAAKYREKTTPRYAEIPMSEELSIRNERCIDLYGVSNH